MQKGTTLEKCRPKLWVGWILPPATGDDDPGGAVQVLESKYHNGTRQAGMCSYTMGTRQILVLVLVLMMMDDWMTRRL